MDINTQSLNKLAAIFQTNTRECIFFNENSGVHPLDNKSAVV